MDTQKIEAIIADLKKLTPKQLAAKKLTPKQVEEQIALLVKEIWEINELSRVSKSHNEKKVIMLKIATDDSYTNFVYGWIKYPDRVDVSIAMTLQNTDPLRGKEIVLENSWLEGDKSIITDTELFLSACTILDDIIGVRQAIVKKNWINTQ